MSDQTGPEADQFAADFHDGAAMAREWIEGKGDLPDLIAIVREMPRGSEMSGREAGFLASLDAAVRGGRQGAAASPDLETAKALLGAAGAIGGGGPAAYGPGRIAPAGP